MQELVWILEPLRVWLDGGTAREVFSTPGFINLALLGAVLLPSSAIALALGTSEWRETPLAGHLGVSPYDPDEGWGARAQLRAMGEAATSDETR